MSTGPQHHLIKYTYLSADRPNSLLKEVPDVINTPNHIILRHCAVNDPYYIAVSAESLDDLIVPQGHEYHEVILLTRPYYFFIDYDEIVPIALDITDESSYQQGAANYHGEIFDSNHFIILNLILNGVEAYVNAHNQRAYTQYLPLLTFNRTNVIILDGSRPYNDVSYKYSFHLIFKDIVLSSYEEALSIYKWLTMYGLAHIDNVYNAIRNMRLIYSYKDHTILNFLDTLLAHNLNVAPLPCSVQDTLITVTDATVFNTFQSKLILDVADNNANMLDWNLEDIDDARLQAIVNYLIKERVWNLMEQFKFGRRLGKYLRLVRITPGTCLICERVHHKDNAWLSLRSTKKGVVVSLHCFRDKNAQLEHLIIDDDLKPKYMFIDEKQIYALACRLKTLTKLAHNEYYLKDALSVKMSEYTLDLTHNPILFIRAGTGSGKTTALIKYVMAQTRINDKFSMIALSFRKTFTADFARRFPDLDLNTYENISGRIAVPHIVVQVDSINRLDLAYYQGRDVLLVMDEIMAILKHMMTGQFLANRGHTILPFVTLLQRSRWCVIMDAYLRQEHVDILKQYLCAPNKLPQVIVDERPSDAQNLFIFYENYENIITKALEIATQEPILICCSTLRDAEMMKLNMIHFGGFEEEEIMLYAGKGRVARNILFEHFTNVDHYWSLYPIVIFTPTLTCGVSSILDRNHMFGIFDFMSPYMPAEECMQMLKRNRTIKTFHIMMKARASVTFDNTFSYQYYLNMAKCAYIGHIAPQYNTKRDIELSTQNSGLRLVYDLYHISNFVQARTNLNPLAALWKCILLYGGMIELAEDDCAYLVTRENIRDVFDERNKAFADYIFMANNAESWQHRHNYEKCYNMQFISPEHLAIYARRDVCNIFKNLEILVAANPEHCYNTKARLAEFAHVELRLKLEWLCTPDWMGSFYLIHGLVKYLGFDHIFAGHAQCTTPISDAAIEQIINILTIYYYKNIIIMPCNYNLKSGTLNWDLIKKDLKLKWTSRVKRLMNKHGLILNAALNRLQFSPLFELCWDHFNTINMRRASHLLHPTSYCYKLPGAPLPRIKIGEDLFCLLTHSAENYEPQAAFYAAIDDYINKAHSIIINHSRIIEVNQTQHKKNKS